MIELGYSGNVDVGLDERIEQTLIWHVDLGDAHDIVNIRNDRDSVCRDEDHSSISWTTDVLYTGCHYLGGRKVLVEAFDRDKFVEFTSLIRNRKLDAG